MPNAKRSSLPTATALLLVSVAPFAQEADRDISRCRDAGSQVARIECLETTIRELHGEDAGSQPPPVLESQEAQATAPAADNDQAAETAIAPPSSVQETQARDANVESQSAPNDPATSEDRGDAAEIGAEQLRRNREEIEASLARASNLQVSRYSTVPYRRLVVHLENGQVWRQIKGDTQHIRASLRRNQTVDLEESSLGGYKLRLNEMRRTIRVERVR